jgi:GT2 family glycosyltransferase
MQLSRASKWRGKLVGWINSDDILYPDCIEKIVEAYRCNSAAVLFYNSKIDIISINGLIIRQDEHLIVDGDALLRRCNTLVQQASFYSSDALIKVGYFNKSLKYSMDLDLWLRLLKVGDCINLACEPIAAYREWWGTKTSTGESKLIKERRKLLLSHGAKAWDKTLLNIYWGLIKCFIKNIPVVGVLIKASVRFVKGLSPQ